MNRTIKLNALRDGEFSLAFFSPRIFQDTERLEKIWMNYIPGLTIVSGNRGVGKSTLINYYKKKYNSDVLKRQIEYKYFHINIQNNGSHFFRDIFLFLESIVLEEKFFSPQEIENINERIKILKDEILFDIAREDIIENSDIYSDERQNEQNLSLNLPIIKILDLKLNKKRNNLHKNSTTAASRVIKTRTNRLDYIQKNLIDLLRLYSQHFKIIFILDELDKMNESDFRAFIVENKVLFLESGLLFIIVIDKEKCIDLQYENDILSSIVREYIYIHELEWSEYIVVASRMSQEYYSVESLREQFYKTRGNYRKLVNDNSIGKNSSRRKTRDLSNFYLFDFFINSEYIRSLPNIIRDVVKDYLFAVIDTHSVVGQLSMIEMEKIRGRFARNELLNSVLLRVEELIIVQKDLASIIKDEDHISLLEEIKKYHHPKEFHLDRVENIINEYKIVNLNTSDKDKLIDFIEGWIDCIDFICITRQEKERSINNISFHCNIFTSSHYTEPTLFLNDRGFAWNHEYYGERVVLKEYLNNKKIPFIEMELEKVLNNHIFTEYSYQKMILGLLLQKYGY
ncbi:P-loop NTPase fold protein [Peribacillus frigoritolerans]|uniref:P-loop NTPase fold protein n=1 Tax=Peribacillus castrilensis TaxID=2897690 RepID=UPI003DA6C3A3